LHRAQDEGQRATSPLESTLTHGHPSMPRIVPILLYHSVSDDPAPWVAPFTLAPRAFEEHMDAVSELGAFTLTVSEFVEALARDPSTLPDPLVLVTFDDGFADFHEVALPVMSRRSIASTLYVTTSFVESGRGPEGDRMLDSAALLELGAAGVELGGHSRTHAQLDTVTRVRLDDEIRGCKAELEDRLASPVRSFAYPHGYSSPRVRRVVRAAGYDSACAVIQAFSSTHDDTFALARLMIRSSTSTSEVRGWIRGRGARPAPAREAASTRVWRAYRRTSVRLGLRSAVKL
jgi:peptidoglycan/xylan/chitin deacetylase (PgdA/CDA1 family)